MLTFFWLELCFCSPEVVAMLNYSPGTLTDALYRTSDIYSLGIVIGHLLERSLPFANPLESTAAPRLTRTTPSALVHLFEQCVAEQRPTASYVARCVERTCARNGVGMSLTDSLLARLSAYASNLERLVDEQTELFVDEKRRCETLLYSVLPRDVAQRLARGDAVEPEAFDSATVYFSEMVGFAEMAASSTPLQVIDLLNEMYTLFDTRIAEYDAYKVRWATMCYGSVYNNEYNDLVLG